jgi:hypothetical protein
MTAGSGAFAARRRAGRIRFILFSTLVLFGGGFYTGVYATKRVIASDSGILHRIFGIQAPAPTVPPAPPASAPAAATVATAAATTQPSAPAAVKPPVTPAPAPQTTPPAPPAQTGSDAAQSSGSPDAEQNAAPAPHAQSSEESGSDQAQLARLVDDYNDSLHRIQDALRHYSVIHQKSLDSKIKPQDLKQLSDQENSLFSDVSRLTKHAENVQDTIRAASNYAVLYMEGSSCAARKDVPTKLLDLDIDKLKFIDKAP